ncbi:hypothetical protein ACFX12_017607 [Malus domestica]
MSTFALHSKATYSTFLHFRECIPNEASRVTQRSSFPGVHLQTSHQKQKYLISSESKANISHGMLFLYPCSCLRDKEKESNRSVLGNIEQRNRPSFLPRACLSYKRNKQRRMQHGEL